MKNWILFFAGLLLSSFSMAQTPDAKEIVRKADEKLKGLSNKSEMKMTIIRPTWTREMVMKTWGKGNDYALVLVTAPDRDKGTAFLKRGKEIWNWQPTIDRVIKMPPSMMSQSWLGSDFKNDDLVQQTSTVNDFSHKLLGMETIDGRSCYKIELIPHEDAAVVWGKVISWIDKTDYLELKTEFYDEDGYLVNTMLGKDVKMMGGKLLPTRMEVIPADEDGNKTILEYTWMEFDTPMDESFFSVQNMKRIK
ncbi:MAG: outer membrane lipoprotein-sorting protein [Saprospirales bacterium]|nr:outer membrane lipoprotein-sorting protein [Saprospirales bacterium]